MEQAQQYVLECLMMSQNPETQKAGEEKLSQANKQEGYGVVLSSIIVSTSVAFPFRQLAGVLLRQYVQKHWDADAQHFVAPAVSDTDKAQIRQILPTALGDESSKLRTAASMVIAAVGTFDFPERWPDLLQNLILSINSDNPNFVQGGLRCLVLFAEDITDVQLSQAIPHLFPALLRVAMNPNYPDTTRARAVTTFQICCSSLLTLSGDEDGDAPSKGFMKLVTRLLTPTLAQWFQLFINCLAVPPQAGEPCGLRLGCIKSLKTFQTYFPKIILQHLGAFAKQVWQNLVAMLPLYTQQTIDGDGDDGGEVDDDGDVVNLAACVYESCEFLVTVMDGGKKAQGALKELQEPLALLAIGYMQMTTEDLATWEEDPGEFCAFEDDFLQSLSVRVSAHKLMLRMLDVYKGAMGAILSAATKRIGESEQLQAQGDPTWWKLREASVFAIGFVAEMLQEPGGAPGFDLQGFVHKVLLADLAKDNSVPYLRARAIWCVSHFATLFSKSPEDGELVRYTLEAVVDGLEVQNATAVRLAAARALGMLCTTLPKEVMAPHMPKSLMLMAELLSHAKEGTLHTTLETLVLAVEVSPDVTAQVEEQLTPLLLQSWSNNASDRLVTEGILEILEGLLKEPQCLQGVTQRTLPALLSILSDSTQHLGGTLEAALDVVTLLVKASVRHHAAIHPELLQQALPTVLAKVINTEDHSVLESGTLCLTAFMRGAAEHVASASINGTPILSIMCQAVAKLLSPDLEDTAAFSVGGLVTQVVFKLSDRLGPDAIVDLIRAVVVRLHQAVYPRLAESLLLIFARLVHAHGVSIVDFLQNIGEVDVHVKTKVETPPAPGEVFPKVEWKLEPKRVNALQFVMQKWVLAQDDFHAPYATKVSLTALSKLLELQDTRVMAIAAQGYPIVDLASENRRVTRRSARNNPLRYTEISVSSKILIAMVKEWQEQLKSKADKAKLAAGDLGSDDEGDEGDEGDYEDEDEEEDNGFKLKRRGESASPFVDADKFDDMLGQYVDLSDLIDDDEAEELQLEEYPESVDDPLNEVDLQDFLSHFLKTFAAHHRDGLMHHAQGLSPEDQQTLQQVLSS